MLIRVTEPGSKQEMFFEASHIRAVVPSIDNPMCCQIVTTWLTPQGFQSFQAIGSAENVAREINQALAGKNMLLQ